MIARHSGVCPRCDLDIVPGVDEIVIRHDHPIHAACAPGADDE